MADEDLIHRGAVEPFRMARARRPLGKARSLAHTSVITVREGASDPATTGSFARRPRVDVNGGASGRAPRQRWERSALRRLSELVDDLLRLVRHVNETGPLPGKSQAFATDTRGGQLAHLEALHRERAGDFSGGRVPGLPTSFRPGRAGRGRVSVSMRPLPPARRRPTRLPGCGRACCSE